jgi:hypothetical protein
LTIKRYLFFTNNSSSAVARVDDGISEFKHITSYSHAAPDSAAGVLGVRHFITRT